MKNNEGAELSLGGTSSMLSVHLLCTCCALVVLF